MAASTIQQPCSSIIPPLPQLTVSGQILLPTTGFSRKYSIQLEKGTEEEGVYKGYYKGYYKDLL